MDWKSIKFDWNRARAFLVTAEEGSLSAAARALQMTQPTLSRQVSALEEELGIALFERVGKGLELTSSGLELLEHVRNMGNAASQLSLTATGQSMSLEGNVCISAAHAIASLTLPKVIHRLRQQHPKINIEIIATNDVSDLKRREADIAVRAFRPTQPDLIAKRLKNLVAQFYATPSYLKQLGNPTSIDGFSHADFIAFEENNDFIDLLNQQGFNLKKENFPIMTENHTVHWELVKQGVAIGIMLTDIGDAEPKVTRILPNHDTYNGELWLVVHSELKTNRRVKTVFDFLADALSETV